MPRKREEWRQKKSKKEMEPGDWLCPNCGDHQFKRNVKCRKCEWPGADGCDLLVDDGGKLSGPQDQIVLTREQLDMLIQVKVQAALQGLGLAQLTPPPYDPPQPRRLVSSEGTPSQSSQPSYFKGSPEEILHPVQGYPSRVEAPGPLPLCKPTATSTPVPVFRSVHNITVELPDDVTDFDQWGAKVVRAGKHKGLTYQEAYQNDPQYAQWLADRCDPRANVKVKCCAQKMSPAMRDLGHYMVLREATKNEHVKTTRTVQVQTVQTANRSWR